MAALELVPNARARAPDSCCTTGRGARRVTQYSIAGSTTAAYRPRPSKTVPIQSPSAAAVASGAQALQMAAAMSEATPKGAVHREIETIRAMTALNACAGQPTAPRHEPPGIEKGHRTNRLVLDDRDEGAGWHPPPPPPPTHPSWCGSMTTTARPKGCFHTLATRRERGGGGTRTNAHTCVRAVGSVLQITVADK